MPCFNASPQASGVDPARMLRLLCDLPHRARFGLAKFVMSKLGGGVSTLFAAIRVEAPLPPSPKASAGTPRSHEKKAIAPAGAEPQSPVATHFPVFSDLNMASRIFIIFTPSSGP